MSTAKDEGRRKNEEEDEGHTTQPVKSIFPKPFCFRDIRIDSIRVDMRWDGTMKARVEEGVGSRGRKGGDTRFYYFESWAVVSGYYRYPENIWSGR